MTIPPGLPRWGVALLAVLAVALTVVQVPTTFNIVVRTEGLSASIGGDHRAHWYLRDATLAHREGPGPIASGAGGPAAPFTGSVVVEPGAAVTFRRVGSGPLEIHARAVDAGGPVATLYGLDESVRRRLSGAVVFGIDDVADRLRQGQSLVFPLTGHVTLGQTVGEQIGPTPALLKGGRVSMLGHALIGRSRFDAGGVTLDPGDAVSVAELPRSADGAPGPFYGLAIVDESTGLTAVLRVVSRTVTISRYASQGYDVGVGVFDRIVGDPFVRTVWTVLGSLLAMAAVIPGLRVRPGGRT